MNRFRIAKSELLIPDFQGLETPLRIVLDAQPDVLNRDTETVPRLYRAVRSGARYQRTLDLLDNAKKIAPSMLTKSGVMVGLGESTENCSSFLRSRFSWSGYPDSRPILAAFQRSSAHRPFLYARRICFYEKRSPEVWLPPRRIRPHGSFQLSRARTRGSFPASGAGHNRMNSCCCRP